jgi:SAM-dependent methyltransferase
MATAQRYDRIGVGYTSFRQPDPHIEAQIWGAVGTADRIVNVGAGTGSYERSGRGMVAVEPSDVMIRQRGAEGPPVVRASAEHLPFPDGWFDVGLALMTIHHWSDMVAGLQELQRVSRRQVIFTFDPSMHDALWVFNEYVSASIGFAEEAPIKTVIDCLGADRVSVEPVLVPGDCTDGFASAYWKRPEVYLSAEARASISAFARLNHDDVNPGMERLARDLESGEWHRRHADLLAQDSLDAGLRLVITH